MLDSLSDRFKNLTLGIYNKTNLFFKIAHNSLVISNLSLILNVSLLSTLLVVCNMYGEYIELLLLISNYILLYCILNKALKLDIKLFIANMILCILYIYFYNTYVIYIAYILSLISVYIVLRDNYRNYNTLMIVNTVCVSLLVINILFNIAIVKLSIYVLNKESDFKLIKEHWTEHWFYIKSLENSNISSYKLK